MRWTARCHPRHESAGGLGHWRRRHPRV